MKVGVLGAVEVRDGDSPVPVGGPRQRRLLAALLVHRPHPVSVDTLVDAVFGDDPPRRAEATLRTYVTRLRKAVPDDVEVVAQPPGYALRLVDPQRVDATRFDSLLDRAEQHLAHQEPASAVAALTEALDLWRGRPFDDVADETWAAPEVRRLEEARTSAREHLVDALVADGRAVDALPVVGTLVAGDPFNESHRLRQARTLYRAGRANDALTALREFRTELADELGVDPSPELGDLEQAILRHDPDLDAGRRVRGYVIGERLGSGASGPVHAAHRPGSDASYAIRVYPAGLADDPHFVRTFADDVRRLGSRPHPALAPVHDAWREPGVAYLVTRRLTGGTLTERLDGEPLTPDDIDALEERIAGAVAAAAEAGVRHGRLTTDAVMYDDAGQPFLTDLALGEGALRDGDDEADLAALLRDAGARPRPAPTPGRSNPYVGLRSFENADAAYFHGRESLVDTLAARVASADPAERLTLLVGPSGSGKSSVVRAGLGPRVRDAGPWLTAVTEPTATPFKELAESLRRVATESASSVLDELADGRASPAEAVHELLDEGDRLLLVVDQLEQLFALPDDRATAYLVSLAHAVRTDPRVSVVATLRADHYDRPLRLPHVGALLQEATLVVPPLDDEGRRRAIVEPARAAGLTVEDDVLAELLTAGRDSLPALQFTLYELAERADGRLTAADLNGLGGLDGAIAHRADTLVSALGERGPEQLHGLFRHLVAVDEDGVPVRRRARVREVIEDAGGPDSETVEAWVTARLLTTDRDPETREPVVQISHEALLTAWPRLRDWVAEERNWLRLVSQARTASADWEAVDRDDGALWRGTRLELADEVLGQHPGRLPEPVTSFLDRSREVRDAERRTEEERQREKERSTRRIRRQRSWLAAALVVLVVAALLAWEQRQDALDSAQRAEDRARAATLGLVQAADEARAEDWTRSLLLAVEARRLDDSPRTRESLLKALSNPSPVPTELHTHDGSLTGLIVDHDSNVVVTKETDGGLTIMDPDGSVRAENVASPPSFHRGGLTVRDGVVVSSGAAEKGRPGVVVHSQADGARVGSIRTRPGEVPDVAFSPGPSGDRFAVTGLGRVRIVDTESLQVVRTLRHPDRVPLTAVHWGLGGHQVYAGSEGSHLARWDLRRPSALPASTTTATPQSVGAPIVDLDEMGNPNEGVLLVAATFDAGTLLLDARTLRTVAGPLGADNAVLGVSVNQAGSELAIASSSRADRWRVFPGRAPVELEPVAGGAGVMYTGIHDLLTAGLDGTVTSWQLRPEVPGLTAHPELGVGSPQLDPTGRVLAMWGFGAGIRLFDAETLEPISTLPFDDTEHISFLGVTFNSDGSRIAALWCRGPSHFFDKPCDGRVGVYDVDTGDPVAGPGPTGQVAGWVAGVLAWSADDAWLGTGLADGAVEIRRATDLSLETTLQDLQGDGFVTEVDFTGPSAPAPRLVATTGTDAATWSVPDWDRLGQSRVGVAARFTPDGRLVTSDQDGTVRVRDETLEVLDTHRGLPLPAIRASFGRDGTRFATIDDFTGETRIWRTEPLAPVGGPITVAGRASWVTLSPEGTRLFIGGDRAWELELDPDAWTDQACEAAGRNLTREEWATHLGDEPYRKTCPQFP